MDETLLAKLQAVDSAILTDVVRQDQRSPSLEIVEWSVRRLTDKGIVNPDGLWLVSGHGQADGATRPWSVVVKIFRRPAQETVPHARHYWKREVALAQSKLLEGLPGPTRGPHFYRTDEYDDAVWLWMEHVEDARATAWSLDDYALAARQLGLWNGAWTFRPIPMEPWLESQPHRAWQDTVNLEKDWQSPFHEKYISMETRARFERLWGDREQFYGVLESLPQCFAHFDGQRRNLLFHRLPDDHDELVIIDWAMCGVSALGAELQALVGGSTSWVEWPSSALAALDVTAFKNYVEGLRASGWTGDTDEVRLGYVAWMAIYRGLIMPPFMTFLSSPENRAYALHQFGLAEEDYYLHLLPLLLFYLDCADEARVLMKKTGRR